MASYFQRTQAPTVVTDTLPVNLFQSFSLPPLYAHQIHLWVASLRSFAPFISQMRPFLSHEDHEKASRFHVETDKKRALISRAILCRLLGDYLNVCPSRIRFKEGKNRKPEIEVAGISQRLSFNVSHSEALILFAFSRYQHTGVDVERIRQTDELESIVHNYFHPIEVKWFHHLSLKERRDAFFDLWTRKEAYLKATGEGLSRPLNSFFVIGEDEGHGRFQVGIDGGVEEKCATGFVLNPASGYPAAVVVF